MRPTWDQYFLAIAKQVSTRSHDLQTKHGAVVVDPNNHIIGTGYNSFAAGLPDDELPKTRPEKYKFMLHSERNALSNCVISPWVYKEGVKVYVTGRPCLDCLQGMINANVRNIVAESGRGWASTKDEEELFFWLLKNSKIGYKEMEV